MKGLKKEVARLQGQEDAGRQVQIATARLNANDEDRTNLGPAQHSICCRLPSCFAMLRAFSAATQAIKLRQNQRLAPNYKVSCRAL